jgi:16S rRNA U1498 N3-methylase RsmE
MDQMACDSFKHLPRLFCPQIAKRQSLPMLRLEDSQREKLLSVLRCKQGDKIRIFAGDGSSDFIAELVGSRLSDARIVEHHISPVPPGLPLNLTLAFCPLAHADAQRDMFTKATELGADAFLPVISERVQHGVLANKRGAAVKSPASSAASLLPEEFYRKAFSHVVAATEQCEKSRLPVLLPATRLTDFVDGRISVATSEERARGQGPLFVAHEGLVASRGGIRATAEERPSPQLLYGEAFKALSAALSSSPSNPVNQRNPLPITVLVGPEGGFSQQDNEELVRLKGKDSNSRFVSLSTNILRAETAAATALAIVGQAAAMAAAAASGAGLK